VNQEFAVIATMVPFTLVSPLAFDHVRGDVIAFLQPGMKDTDKDGLTDAEEESGGTLANDSDTDKDGFLDGAEALSGTDPLDADSMLRILSVSHDSAAGSATIIWSSVPGRNYTLEVRIGLGSDTWSPVAVGVAREAALAVSVPDPEEIAGEGRFYRIRLGE